MHDMTLRLAVIWSQGRWTLIAPRARFDRYSSRESALAAAGRLADQARRQGWTAEVLLQDIGGQLTPAPIAESAAGR